jgi:hypothetical protein
MTEESKDQEVFLDRWSRRKLEHAEEKPAPPKKAEAEAPAVPLPPVDGLTPDSDFKPFMAANVDGATRRAALKKLFADAHFNIPDPYEAYSEDWTVGEKIPMEMLKTLNHAQKLLFEEVDKTAKAPIEKPETPQPEPKDTVGKQDA